MKEIIRGYNKIDTDYTYNAWNADGGRLFVDAKGGRSGGGGGPRP